MNRRRFLLESTSLAAGLAGALRWSGRLRAEWPASLGARGANERLRVAVIGVHTRGLVHIRSLAGRPGCEVVAVCDVDDAMLGPAVRAAEKAQGRRPRAVKDLRRILDDPSVDAVTIAMPNHWHALAGVWAMQAGKDVYVEKPVSHTLREGRLLVDTAQRTGRICQSGLQCRSNPATREAIEFLRAGKLGRVRLARGLCYKLRPPIGQSLGKSSLPAGADYDLWCGPAPLKPLGRCRLHYDWHWFWDYGDGDLGNQGVHQLDIARWGLGQEAHPRAVQSVGGRFGPADDGQTPNTQVTVFDYGDSELIFEVRGLPTRDLLGARIGNIFYGTQGYLVCTSYTAATAFSPEGQVIRRFEGGGDHFANFLAAVRSRRAGDLHASILDGHRSTALCHLGNISYRLGREANFDQASHACRSDRQACEALERMAEHLRLDSVPTGSSLCRVGPRLEFDSEHETFRSAPQADSLLARDSRKGFG